MRSITDAGAVNIFYGGPTESQLFETPVTEFAVAGSVNVIDGTSSGLSSNGDQTWDQGDSGVGGVLEAGDRLGSSLY